MRDRDDGVSAVLGTMLMMALMATLIPGAIMMKQSWSDVQEAQIDAARAQKEAAHHEAFCARHPEVGPPDCDSNGPMRGYDCRYIKPGTWLCTAATNTTPPTQPTLPTIPSP